MNQQTYSDFKQRCVTELLVLQDSFAKQFDFDSYDHWFYNQITGLLTLSKGPKELNFKYLEIGTYSKITQTWKWSWDNEHTPDSVRENIDLVRSFGVANNFDRLTEGCFASNEIEAWEFTAITAKLISGIGAYRPVSDDNIIFMLLLEFVESSEASKIKDRYVQCTEHEFRRRAFVCKHLNKVVATGFEESFQTHENTELHDDDDLQAWCSECEQERLKEGEWNDKSMEFAQIKLICEKCYFEMKEFNLGHR